MQRSWGKVIFSEACVKNSVHGGGMGGVRHGGGGCVWQGGMYGRGGAWQGGRAWQGHAWQGGMHSMGLCMAGGSVHGGGHAWQGGVRGRYYEIRSMSGRYASYWNAFLLFIFY